TQKMGSCSSQSCQSCFFEYETERMIVVKSKVVGSVFRLIQFLILVYVIGYVCVVQKSYQETDSVISSVTTKVKGTGFTNTSDLGARVWDVADYNIPPQGDSSFFVLTNMIVTPNQTQSTCPEVSCIQTGLCMNYKETVKTCEVLSWCPLEIDINLPEHALLAAAEDFTVLIKNSVTYPKFNFHKRNILPDVNSSYLKQCEFNRKTDPYCPIFRLKDMVSEAEEDFQTMAIRGGVLGIMIDWSCDLDWPEHHCGPKYSFRRLDNKIPENNVAPGYNFRFAKYYKTTDGRETRTLIKAYGILFDVIVFGTAGKFNMVPTIVNLGAALTFLSLVSSVKWSHLQNTHYL
uniref:Purinergic receptor P2X, ligand-gated ion channel, 4b n=1 Tax=Salmo trutta TaxID=8032 RepID=A0A673X6K5_SALTR